MAPNPLGVLSVSANIATGRRRAGQGVRCRCSADRSTTAPQPLEGRPHQRSASAALRGIRGRGHWRADARTGRRARASEVRAQTPASLGRSGRLDAFRRDERGSSRASVRPGSPETTASREPAARRSIGLSRAHRSVAWIGTVRRSLLLFMDAGAARASDRARAGASRCGLPTATRSCSPTTTTTCGWCVRMDRDCASSRSRAGSWTGDGSRQPRWRRARQRRPPSPRGVSYTRQLICGSVCQLGRG
jgi:hypothetical protein